MNTSSALIECWRFWRQLKVTIAAAGLIAVSAKPTEAQSLLWYVDSDVPNEGFGRSDVGADRDLDGLPDLLVANPSEDCLNVDDGAVHLFSTTSGKLQSWCGDGYWGVQAQWVDDVDGGGLDDFVITQPGWYEPTTFGWGTGRIQLISSESGAVLFEWQGKQSNGWFGAIDVLGDVDGDGYRDLLVGASSYGTSGQGQVWVYSVRTGAELRTHLGGSPYLALGEVIRALPDVDGDAVADYAVTASPNSGHGMRVDVRSGRTGGLIARIHTTDLLGQAISECSDLDGDGLPDLLIGGIDAEGFVEAWSPMSVKKLWRIDGQAVGEYFGNQVMGLSDLDGDGFEEFLITAVNDDHRGKDAGRVDVISGRTHRALFRFYPPVESLEYYGQMLARGADFNGDGIEDLVIGTGYGGKYESVGGHVAIYAGNDLWLQAEPPNPAVGDTVIVDLRGGEPGLLGLIALIDVDGTAMFAPLLVAPFDANGELQLSADIDPSVSGIDFTLMAYAQNRLGRGPLMDASPFVVKVQ